MTDFDRLLTQHVRPSPLTLRPPLPSPSSPWSPEARAALLGVVLGARRRDRDRRRRGVVLIVPIR